MLLNNNDILEFDSIVVNQVFALIYWIKDLQYKKTLAQRFDVPEVEQ